MRLNNGIPVFERLEDLHSVGYQTDGTYGTYVRLLAPGGEILYSSPNFEGHGALAVALPTGAAEETLSRHWEGGPIRSRYVPIVSTAGDPAGWLEVTSFEWSLHKELERLANALFVGIALSVLLAAGGGYMLARRALRPVAAITEAANQIRSVELNARLPTDFKVRDELTKLAETINGLLARLEGAFQRERRFTSNAAHELITPLTTMRGELELALREDRGGHDSREAIEMALRDIDQMNDIIRALLRLSQAERLQDMPRAPVDASKLCAEHVGRFQDRADARETTLVLDAQPGLILAGDFVNLGKAIDNLLDNAFKYTPPGGRIDVRVNADGADVLLEIQDTGIGFTKAEAEHLFDRFYRADAKEVRAQAGSGLGLAIVQTIVEAYDGTIVAASAGPNTGSTFTIRIPRVE